MEHARGCSCGDCFAQAIERLREAENVSRQLRETAIRLIARKWDKPERAVAQALRR